MMREKNKIIHKKLMRMESRTEEEKPFLRKERDDDMDSRRTRTFFQCFISLPTGQVPHPSRALKAPFTPL